MHRALALARRGLGLVEPNPLVGCVLVRDGRVIGQGWHQRFGGPHAEVEALGDCRAAGHDPAGCDVYVTLEPCCHFGKTPPCTDALIAAGVARVVAAMVDPFPEVSGRGLARLRQAGIAVVTGVGGAAARELNAPFLKRIATGLPWVIAKWAQTLDGKIATRSGDSRWISNERSRRAAHRLRARVDAVVVGVGTVVADDPRLTARGVRRRRIARRVVIDPRLRLPLDSALVRSLADGPLAAPLTVATSARALADQAAAAERLRGLGAELVALPPLAADPQPPAAPGPRPPDAPPAGPRLDLRPLLEHLSRAHAASNVLIEGGAGVLGAALGQGLIDEVMVFVAPRLLADGGALSPLAGPPRPRLEQAHGLRLHTTQRLGDDVLLTYRQRA